MSLQANCFKCGKVFLKTSMKSKQKICRECQVQRADGEQTESTNRRVVNALEEMNKKEILKLLQTMQTKQDELQTKVDELTGMIHDLPSVNVDDLIANKTFDSRIKKLVRVGLNTRLGPIRDNIRQVRALQEDHTYWKEMVRHNMEEIQQEE
jgi:predicted  nucleic acid-binding Zn-ribbon protein